MKKQLVLFVDAYGKILYENNQEPIPYHNMIQDYIDHGWTVISFNGVGVSSQYFNRGSFCFLLEKLNNE